MIEESQSRAKQAADAIDPENWDWCIELAYKHWGPMPQLGSFDPVIGDVAKDGNGKAHIYCGDGIWHPPVLK